MRPAIRCWEALLLVTAATPALLRADDARDLARTAQSPYHIERFVETHAVFDWVPLWKTLKLTDDTGLPPCEMRVDAGHDCSSESIMIIYLTTERCGRHL